MDNVRPSSRFTGPIDQVGAYIEAHDFEKAFEALQAPTANLVAAASGAEAASQYHNTRGWLQLQLGRPTEALEDCLEARKANPNLDQNNLNLARISRTTSRTS